MGKVLIVGCGGVASVAVHKCCQNSKVFDAICIASRTVSKCEALKEKLQDSYNGTITTAQVDADNPEELIALIEREKPDVVLNLALPYQDLTIMDACLATGVDYVDTANYEPEDTAKFEYKWQWAYREKYEKAGITALLGSGFDPGVTGVFSAYALKHYFDISYELVVYEEHSLTKGSSSKAVAYVGIGSGEENCWGVGVDADIIKASIAALEVAVNKMESVRAMNGGKDKRLLEITNYIYANYKTVTLDDLAEQFFLSKPYLSKYIKEKSGMTFGDILKKVRMKKARAMLKSSNATVESIAESVGYQNVEHFNRIFKKMYEMTPVQYRNQK